MKSQGYGGNIYGLFYSFLGMEGNFQRVQCVTLNTGKIHMKLV